jgi:hypothetical protein
VRRRHVNEKVEPKIKNFVSAIWQEAHLLPPGSRLQVHNLQLCVADGSAWGKEAITAADLLLARFAVLLVAHVLQGQVVKVSVYKGK